MIPISFEIIFKNLKPKTFYTNCFKVWGHRGYFKTHTQNSIKSINHAFDLGARGVEIDVFYDIKDNAYIVSHNFPYRKHEGQTLKLKDVFASAGDRGYFWLDFKNLKSIRGKNVDLALEALLSLLKEFNLIDKTTVESPKAKQLSVFSKAGIHTSYLVKPHKNKNYISTKFHLFKIKLALVLYDFSAVSIKYANYNNHFAKTFQNFPVHLFTINDLSTIKTLGEHENIKVILSDNNYFQENVCK